MIFIDFGLLRSLQNILLTCWRALKSYKCGNLTTYITWSHTNLGIWQPTYDSVCNDNSWIHGKCRQRFYPTFTNVFFIFSTFLRFLTFVCQRLLHLWSDQSQKRIDDRRNWGHVSIKNKLRPAVVMMCDIGVIIYYNCGIKWRWRQIFRLFWMSKTAFSLSCCRFPASYTRVIRRSTSEISWELLIHSKNFLQMSNLETSLLLLKIQTFVIVYNVVFIWA